MPMTCKSCLHSIADKLGELVCGNADRSCSEAGDMHGFVYEPGTDEDET